MCFPVRGRCPASGCWSAPRRAFGRDRAQRHAIGCRIFLGEVLRQFENVRRRSRSGGIFKLTTLSRNSRSSRKLPSRDGRPPDCRFEVAADADVDRHRLGAPTRSITRSWIARSNLDWQPHGPSRRFRRAARCRRWPSLELSDPPCHGAVKAPFSWPNSSDSSRCRGCRAQFDRNNGRLARAEAGVDVAASTSLPVRIRR